MGHMAQFQFHIPANYINFCTVHRDDGYVVNDSNEWELHHAWCEHIQSSIRLGQNVLSYEKYGDLDPNHLRAAARVDRINLTEDCYCMQM